MGLSDVLRFLTVFNAGVAAGTLLMSLVALMPAAGALERTATLRVSQRFDELVDRYNPPLVVSAAVAAALLLILGDDDRSGAADAFTAIGLGGLVVLMAVSVRAGAITKRVKAMAGEPVPPEFAALRAQWLRLHAVRTAGALTALTAFALAAAWNHELEGLRALNLVAMGIGAGLFVSSLLVFLPLVRELPGGAAPRFLGDARRRFDHGAQPLAGVVAFLSGLLLLILVDDASDTTTVATIVGVVAVGAAGLAAVLAVPLFRRLDRLAAGDAVEDLPAATEEFGRLQLRRALAGTIAFAAFAVAASAL